MKTIITHSSKNYQIDLSKPLDISIPINASEDNLNAWYSHTAKILPVKIGTWTGSVAEGGSINFNDIYFNPHSHITHTECVGHITKKVHSVNENLKQYFFLSELITITPEQFNGDFVISKKQLQDALENKERDAVIIRTIPNLEDKKQMQYSNTNPPYLLEEAAIYLLEKGIKHLLIDLPSVDKEIDKGELLSHNAFWNTSADIRLDATITELIYVPDNINDGTYFLNLMIAPFENDATPSKPILYEVLGCVLDHLTIGLI